MIFYGSEPDTPFIDDTGHGSVEGGGPRRS